MSFKFISPACQEGGSIEDTLHSTIFTLDQRVLSVGTQKKTNAFIKSYDLTRHAQLYQAEDNLYLYHPS